MLVFIKIFSATDNYTPISPCLTNSQKPCETMKEEDVHKEVAATDGGAKPFSFQLLQHKLYCYYSAPRLEWGEMGTQKKCHKKNCIVFTIYILYFSLSFSLSLHLLCCVQASRLALLFSSVFILSTSRRSHLSLCLSSLLSVSLFPTTHPPARPK